MNDPTRELELENTFLPGCWDAAADPATRLKDQVRAPEQEPHLINPDQRAARSGQQNSALDPTPHHATLFRRRAANAAPSRPAPTRERVIGSGTALTVPEIVVFTRAPVDRRIS